MRLYLFLLFLSSTSLRSLCAQQPTAVIPINSPNKALAVTIRTGPTGRLTYQVAYKGKPVIEPSGLSFDLSKPSVSLTQFAVIKADSSTTDETWKPVWGETSQIRNHYNELALTLQDKSGSGIQLRVRFQVFDDGVGFRYESEIRGHVVGDAYRESHLGAGRG